MLWIRSVVVQVSSVSVQVCCAISSKTASSPRPSHLSQSGLPSTSSAIRWNSGATRWSKRSKALWMLSPNAEQQRHSLPYFRLNSPQRISSSSVLAKVNRSSRQPSAWFSTDGVVTAKSRKFLNQLGRNSNFVQCSWCQTRDSGRGEQQLVSFTHSHIHTKLWLDWNLFSGFCTNLPDFRQLRQLNCAKLKKNSPIWLNLLHMSKKSSNFARNCVQGKTQSLNNTNMADILQTIERYRALGRR